MRPTFFALACVVATCATGCGRRGPELMPVRGVVRLDGKPLAAVNVAFVPAPGTPGSGGHATTKADGRFDIVATIGGVTRPGFGAQRGRHLVAVAEPEVDVVDGVPVFRSPSRPLQVPSRYGIAETSGLEVEVTEGMADVVLDLKSK